MARETSACKHRPSLAIQAEPRPSRLQAGTPTGVNRLALGAAALASCRSAAATSARSAAWPTCGGHGGRVPQCCARSCTAADFVFILATRCCKQRPAEIRSAARMLGRTSASCFSAASFTRSRAPCARAPTCRDQRGRRRRRGRHVRLRGPHSLGAPWCAWRPAVAPSSRQTGMLPNMRHTLPACPCCPTSRSSGSAASFATRSSSGMSCGRKGAASAGSCTCRRGAHVAIQLNCRWCARGQRHRNWALLLPPSCQGGPQPHGGRAAGGKRSRALPLSTLDASPACTCSQ